MDLFDFLWFITILWFRFEPFILFMSLVSVGFDFLFGINLCTCVLAWPPFLSLSLSPDPQAFSPPQVHAAPRDPLPHGRTGPFPSTLQFSPFLPLGHPGGPTPALLRIQPLPPPPSLGRSPVSLWGRGQAVPIPGRGDPPVPLALPTVPCMPPDSVRTF